MQVPNDAKVKSLDVHGEAFLTRNWGVTGYGIVDDGVFRREDLGVVYRDDCIRVEVLYRHDETFNGTLGSVDFGGVAPFAGHFRNVRICR